MNIKIISKVLMKGEETGLYNYQYVDSKDNPISAIFQATIGHIESLKKTVNPAQQ
jgi:hypothetical protein